MVLQLIIILVTITSCASATLKAALKTNKQKELP